VRKNVYPKGKGFWNVARIKRAAKKFKYRYEWRKDKSYDAAKRFRVVNDKNISGHLLNIRPTRRNWTNTEIIKIAKKFRYKEEWRQKHNGSYQASWKQGVFLAATKHMVPMGSRYYRCLYSIEIKGENKIYIGLTFNYHQRIKAHLETKRFKKYKKSLIFKKLTKYLHKDKAAKLENIYINKMKKKGYIILNSKIGGGLGGGPLLWNRKNILESAKKYKTIKEWEKFEDGACQAARKKGLMKEASKHMIRLWEFKWTKKKVFQDALKYKTRTEWARSSRSYDRAQRKGWLKKASKHMRDGNIYWTKDKVLIEAKKYKKRIDFQNKSRGAYQAARRIGCYKEATKHMKRLSNQFG